ncbi:hypothetical protein A3A63_01845 [Candidatus Gottesmanbacteria bacterium RIFCSPLOWO2_01_FULL_46_9]|uniref:F-type ATPase subunit delta n=1 Tax=Candidatus Gottesmanbacteria bacterium RIFCSPLOWO2_01_FULL_46_9 TaxID=1798394 RepID=A0A1F6AZD7_9BACT|nr:MAG: hypothetical protein A3A63_01845 [Candidatus Gottesmanbacteria bacterium RIFCSPLOWO2_01_FULL_46_9]
MNDQELFQAIIDTSFVKTDVMRRTRIIREFLEQKFYTPGEKRGLTAFLEHTNTSDDDMKIMEHWGEPFFNSFTKENAYDLLENVKGRMNDLPTINLYVPLTLGPTDIPRLGAWCRKNIDKNILIELHVEPSTFGGCAFAWNGIYMDYSLRHYLRKRLDAVRNILSDYEKK